MSHRKFRAGRTGLTICLGLTLSLVGASDSSAQVVNASSIEGIVSDATGAVLPGVSATLESPQLIAPQVVRVTDGEGAYRFTGLGIGTYTVTYALPGFSTVIREGIRLTDRFTARINVELELSTVQETITVSGQSPVVDVTSAATVQTLTREVIESVPNSGGQFELMAMAPGMRVGRIDVGGSTMANYQSARAYGQRGQITPTLDGINTRQYTSSMGSYYDYASLDEVTITAVGNTAEIATAGMNFAAIIKSGTNQFHGRYFGAYQDRRMQSDNLDGSLMERGVTRGSSFKDYSDLSGSLGGPLWRNRIWFYGDYKRQRKAQNEVNFALDGGPDGLYLTPDDTTEDGRGDGRRELNSQTIKTTFQLSRGYRLDAFYHRSGKVMPERFGTQFRPLETTNDYLFNPQTGKIELNGTPSNRLVYTLTLGRHYYLADYQPRAGVDTPTRFDRASRVWTGSAARADRRPRNRWQYLGSLTYYPGGDHAIKTGVQLYRETHGTGQASHDGGNFQLQYEGANLFDSGMAGNPSRVVLYNYPVDPTNRVDVNSAYVTDEWRVTRRLTANLGLRFDQYSSYVPEQFKGPDDFGLFFQGSVNRLDVVDWQGLAPRIGLAYDLRGDGRTVIRGAYNYFQQSLGDSFASTYNLNAIASATYLWNDSIPDNNYTPGEVNLDVNGPDFVSITGAANSVLPNDPRYGRELKQSNTQELSIGIQHELMPSVAARAVYVYKREAGLFDTRGSTASGTQGGPNILRPLSAYTVPVSRRDPGPDGVLDTADDTGNMIQFADYGDEYRGAAFVGNQRINYSEPDFYHSYEFTLERRLRDGWQGLVSFIGTQNHRWLPNASLVDLVSPQVALHGLDESWEWGLKAHGSYMFPGDVQFGVFYQSLSGFPLQRTARFLRNDPDGLFHFRNQGTQTIRMEPYGASKLTAQHVWNVRLSKFLDMGPGRFQLAVEVFNLLNANDILRVQQVSGPSFGNVLENIPPRIARISATYDF